MQREEHPPVAICSIACVSVRVLAGTGNHGDTGAV